VARAWDLPTFGLPGYVGDPHLHNERKAEEIANQVTGDTGAEGDMQVHAERKVDQMSQEMYED
jgi:hypothetical protein